MSSLAAPQLQPSQQYNTVVGVKADVLEHLVEISQQAQPKESVAALYGHAIDSGIVITSARELANSARSSRQFIVASDQLQGTIAFFHSHPITRTFSAQDRSKIARSPVPWIVGFPSDARRSPASFFHYQHWTFAAEMSDGAGGTRACLIFID